MITCASYQGEYTLQGYNTDMQLGQNTSVPGINKTLYTMHEDWRLQGTAEGIGIL